jgi:SAM-dependent methyltransferase
MGLPAEVSRDKTERLRGQQPAGAERVEEAAVPPRRSLRRRVLRVGKGMARVLLGRALSEEVRVRISEPLESARVAQQRIDQLEQQVVALQRGATEVQLVAVEVHAASVNFELLKGEVRSVVQMLEDLGMAIAPGSGLGAARDRLSELRERVNGLDRRLRFLVSGSSAPAGQQPSSDAVATAPATPAPATPAPATPAQSALFDYVGFERRFRGDPEAVAAELATRYLDLLVDKPPVVDIGCGNAGLVELLTKRGVEAIGVDTDPSMVAEARDRGLDVRLVDGNSFLRDRDPGSIGAIIATQVVEHLEFADLVQLLELAASRLKPGGVLIAETPNPGSLIVLGTTFITDPTHVRPLHPSLLTFLCEGAGFHDVRLRYYAPATYYHLPLIDDREAPAWTKQVNEAFSRLNSVLFGPQDYAIIATTADERGDDHGASGNEVTA